MAQTLRLSMFQSLTGLAGTWMRSPKKAIKTAFDMISSYLLTCSLVALIISIDVGVRCGRAAPFVNVIWHHIAD